jgi:hypothetical protein
MDPWIEVSTLGGKNMRETCARVLAAALLMGAIASVVGMAAHLGAPTDTGGAIAAPPSSLQRTVRLTVRPASKAPPHVARLVTAPPATVHRPRRAVTTRLIVTKHRNRRPAPKRQLATTPPAPAPAPASAPVPPPTTTEAQPPAPVPDQPDNHGHGHAYGRDGHDGRDDQDE